MNWEVAAAVGELVGAFAVVVSLVYLAAQIRQNTRSVEEQTRAHHVASLTAVSQTFTAFRTMIANSDTNAALWEKASTGLADLTPSERRQYDFLLVEMLWAWSMPYFFVQEGVFDPGLWEQSRRNLGLFVNDGIREWWRVSPHRSEFPPDFARQVDEMIQTTVLDDAAPAS